MKIGGISLISIKITIKKMNITKIIHTIKEEFSLKIDIKLINLYPHNSFICFFNQIEILISY